MKILDFVMFLILDLLVTITGGIVMLLLIYLTLYLFRLILAIFAIFGVLLLGV